MYCKRSSEILTDANRKILSEKVQLVKLFSTESEFFFGNSGENPKQRGNASLLQRDGRPCSSLSSSLFSLLWSVFFAHSVLFLLFYSVGY